MGDTVKVARWYLGGLFVWKTLVLVVVALAMTAGLVAFTRSRLWLSHQRPYYVYTYKVIAEYKLKSWLASLRGESTQASAEPGLATSVPVLLYHGVGPKPDGENLSIQNFTAQLLALKQAGWQTISIQDFYDFMYKGKQLPAKSFLLTFDDGRSDSYYPVDPLLATLHYRATMFVITKSSFSETYNKFYLNKAELTAMRDSGRWDLQPHTAYGHYFYPVNAAGKQGHFYNNKLWLADQNRLETDEEFAGRVLADLQLAKSDIRQEVGSSGVAFAFPYNEFGVTSENYPASQQVLLKAVKQVYPIAFYQIWANRGSSQNFPQDNYFLMKRILVDSSQDAAKLLSRLNASAAKPLPYHSDMKLSNAWIGTWGHLTWEPEGLTIGADQTGTGAAVFLDGGMAWHNYTADSRVALRSGDWIKVQARYRDDRNYASCTFMPQTVLLEETIDGTTHQLARATGGIDLGNLHPSIRVQDTHMDCLDGDTALVSTDDLSRQLLYGSVGFSVYGASPGSSLEIREIEAKAMP